MTMYVGPFGFSRSLISLLVGSPAKELDQFNSLSDLKRSRGIMLYKRDQHQQKTMCSASEKHPYGI
jgi:hypothetical protein